MAENEEWLNIILESWTSSSLTITAWKIEIRATEAWWLKEQNKQWYKSNRRGIAWSWTNWRESGWSSWVTAMRPGDSRRAC